MIKIVLKSSRTWILKLLSQRINVQRSNGFRTTEEINFETFFYILWAKKENSKKTCSREQKKHTEFRFIAIVLDIFLHFHVG